MVDAIHAGPAVHSVHAAHTVRTVEEEGHEATVNALSVFDGD